MDVDMRQISGTERNRPRLAPLLSKVAGQDELYLVRLGEKFSIWGRRCRTSAVSLSPTLDRRRPFVGDARIT
jgi:hypothetical protein